MVRLNQRAILKRSIVRSFVFVFRETRFFGRGGYSASQLALYFF